MEGAWPPGERLEALRLADEFGVSMTPVRDCLNRLVGERMVDLKPGEGYRVPRIGEQYLREMLDVNLALLDYSFHVQPARRRHALKNAGCLDHGDRVAVLFATIASRSDNAMLDETLRSLSDRLHVFRNCELSVFDDAVEQVDELVRLARADDPDLVAKIHAYHERQKRSASRLIRTLY